MNIREEIEKILESCVWLQDIDSPKEGAFIDAEGIPDMVDQILSHLKSQIEQIERIPPYNLNKRDDVLKSEGYAEAILDILSKLQ